MGESWFIVPAVADRVLGGLRRPVCRQCDGFHCCDRLCYTAPLTGREGGYLGDPFRETGLFPKSGI